MGRQSLRVQEAHDRLDGPCLDYPLASSGGRLRWERSGPAAVVRFLALCMDVAPGDFVSLPELQNPCDPPQGIDHRDVATELRELCGRMQRLFASMRRTDIRVRPADSRVHAVLLVGRQAGGSWSLSIPLEVTEQRIVLHLDRSESREVHDGPR